MNSRKLNIKEPEIFFCNAYLDNGTPLDENVENEIARIVTENRDFFNDDIPEKFKKDLVRTDDL